MFHADPDKRYELNWFERWAAELLKQGPMPTHIALILDGNRRFARKNKLGSVTEGHRLGCDKLCDIISIMFDLGINEVSAYVFSIENFKRSEDEVSYLMKMLEEKTELTPERIRRVKKSGICEEVLGNVDQCHSAKIQVSLEKLMLLCKDGQRMKINFAFVYTGRDEITKGVNHLLRGLSEGKLEMEHLSEELLRETFTLHPSNPVDLFIRTSGECRLSDYLMWQSTNAHYEFVEETWPEFNFWGLFKTIWRYQNQILYKGFRGNANHRERSKLKPKAVQFVSSLREEAWNKMVLNTASTN